MKDFTRISVEIKDKGRPKERPPKTNWRIEMIKNAMKALQYASPRRVASVVWYYFTMPGRVNFTDKQKELISQAEQKVLYFKGDKIFTYKWGKGGPKILLCHGWRSKAADFRRMIEALLGSGFEVHAIDLRAHGQSDGKHTSMPEYRDILKDFFIRNGRFHSVVGYSLGGISAGITLSEMHPELQPAKFFIIASPPYVSYFFKDVINEVGLNEAVYHKMAEMVNEVYHEPIEYFDLRDKKEQLSGIEKYLIYCENDKTIPFEKGLELNKALDDSHFVHASGFGHYKIISHEEIIRYVVAHASVEHHTY